LSFHLFCQRIKFKSLKKHKLHFSSRGVAWVVEFFLHTQLPVQVPLLCFSSSSFYEDSRLIFSLTLYDVIYAARNLRLNCPFRPVKPEVQDKAETRRDVLCAMPRELLFDAPRTRYQCQVKSISRRLPANLARGQAGRASERGRDNAYCHPIST
jgi:hypothetical protein